ncbi:MAG: hypothetical protein JNM70_01230 [Anaerolineae bacterium]|nr:hypothetical protein [Anaerolineae bacterium]
MFTETPLQYDMFTGEAVDNRTRTQRERDRQSVQPVQMLMFSQRDMAQTDVNPYPRMDVSPGPLKLIVEDLRTEEERESELLRQAQAATIDLFAVETPVEPAVVEAEEIEVEEPLIPEAPTPEAARTAALRNLERAVEDITSTLAAAPDVLRAQTIWLAEALVEAHWTGVDSEMIAGLLKRISQRGKIVPLLSEPKPTPTTPSPPNYSLMLPFPFAPPIEMSRI